MEAWRGTEGTAPLATDPARVMVLPLVTLSIVIGVMLVEAWVSRRHERRLLARGAIEPADDVYRWMRVAYPAAFVLLAVAGAARGTPGARWWQAGLMLFAAAKLLKYWAVAALGVRWTFRVLVPPDEPPVRSGPYRYLRHPNYLAVIGELVGMACMMGAPIAGTVACAGFGVLMARRIRVEERMVYRPSPRRRGP